MLFTIQAYAQTCHCPPGQEQLFHYASLGVCGQVYDSSATDFLIKKFTICNKDSIIINEGQNETGYFIFQKLQNGISLIALDIQTKKGKQVYPKNFATTTVKLVRGQLIRTEDETPAEPVVMYLQNSFKKFREL